MLASGAAGAFQPQAGPDVPQAEDGAQAGLPRWPNGWHDHLQYHLFFEGLFVQARVFKTPSLEEHSLWIFDHKVGKVQELLNSPEPVRQSSDPHLNISSARLHVHEGPGGGELTLSGDDGQTEMQIEIRNKHVFSWLPAGQDAAPVIHRPDLEVKMIYKGEERVGRGYSKRYSGEYGPHWGYRFIQSSWLGGDKFLWTADATFRLGDGEAKYNYFKLLDGRTGHLVNASSEDTYQTDCSGYACIDGERYVATVEPLGEWVHDYKGGDTNSRMQLRYCRITVDQGSGKPALEGYALNERCFGTL